MSALAPQKNKNEEKVSKVIDKVLRQIFGDEATLLIYNYLKNNCSLRQDEIVEKIDIFAKGLEEFLRSGAHVIEMKILEDIYSNYGQNHRLELKKINKHDFVSQMKMLRARL